MRYSEKASEEMTSIKNRDYFEKKYPKEMKEYFATTNVREAECMDTLLDYGMTEVDFLAHVVSIKASKEFERNEQNDQVR